VFHCLRTLSYLFFSCAAVKVRCTCIFSVRLCDLSETILEAFDRLSCHRLADTALTLNHKPLSERNSRNFVPLCQSFVVKAPYTSHAFKASCLLVVRLLWFPLPAAQQNCLVHFRQFEQILADFMLKINAQLQLFTSIICKNMMLS